MRNRAKIEATITNAKATVDLVKAEGAAVPDTFRHIPDRLQPWVSYRCIRPAGSVEMGDGKVRLVLDDRSERIVDHVLLGTGYAVDVSRYPFLAPVVAQLETAAGYPRLGPGLESTVPGLHSLGAPAAHASDLSCASSSARWFAAPALAVRASGRPQPRLRLSF